jgi:hypothetical protein
MAISLADCDVEILQDKDFDEAEDGGSSGPYPSNPIHTSYFTQYVRLCKIMGEIFATYYSATSKVANKDASETYLQYDQRLTEWLQQRPPEMVWGKEPHEFWAAILHLHYWLVPSTSVHHGQVHLDSLCLVLQSAFFIGRTCQQAQQSLRHLAIAHPVIYTSLVRQHTTRRAALLIL